MNEFMSRASIAANIRLARSACVLLTGLAISISPEVGIEAAHTDPSTNETRGVLRAVGSMAPQATASQCETAGKKEITIMCDYMATPHASSKNISTPRIVLNRLMISFKPNKESHMVVELTFTNEETARISDARTSYLAIDDDAGQNHVRRVLQQVDFRKLAPSQRLTFSDRLLVGSFRPGHYTIYLWIPNPDPALKFNPARNFLLSSLGVADTVTGLNTLARFSVVQ
jgi:hypothetical protein